MAKQKFELVKLKANDLKELDGWKVKMEDLVEKNPYIEIVDAESYKEAKMSRTALKSGRTEVQNQDKAIGSFLRTFRKSTKDIGDGVISIIQPHETKQQIEIDRWEKILSEKVNEKILKEEKRVEDIKDGIDSVKTDLNELIDLMTFKTIKQSIKTFEDHVKTEWEFDEFDVLFDDVVDVSRARLEEKIQQLDKSEYDRIKKIRDDQQAEINRRNIHATTIIDNSNPENQHNLIERIDEIMLSEFDFGDFKSFFDETRVAIIDKALDRIKWIQNNQVTEQRNRVINVREGLLDIIFQMTVEDYAEKTIYVEKALTQKVADLLVEDEFAKMVSRVKPALKTKLEFIAKEIQKTKERIAKRTTERKKQLKEIGLAWNEADKYFHCEGIDDINESVIDDLEHAEWQTYINSLKILVTRFADENNLYQKRVKRLKADKVKMVKMIKEIEVLPVYVSGIKNEETLSLMEDIGSELDVWVVEKLNQIEEL